MSEHEWLMVALGYATRRTVLDCSWHTTAAVAGLQLAVVSTTVHSREVMHLVCTSAMPMSRIRRGSRDLQSNMAPLSELLTTGSFWCYFQCLPWHLVESHVPGVLNMSAGEAGK